MKTVLENSTFCIQSTRVVFSNEIKPASLHIENGKISKIGKLDEFQNHKIKDFGNLVVAPGIVDTHAHINEPGRTDWEGFQTATKAAAAGGITTVIDMPLNSIPATTSLAALETKIASAKGKCAINYGFWGGVILCHHRSIFV